MGYHKEGRRLDFPNKTPLLRVSLVTDSLFTSTSKSDELRSTTRHYVHGMKVIVANNKDIS